MRPPYDAALVLGVELDADDAPTEELARRVMAAARAYRGGACASLVLCGGCLPGHRRSEAEVMARMLAALGVLYFANSYIEILICVGVFAFALSCVFSIVYSLALRRRPDKANEISGLMITGVCGGAIIPPLMGLLTETVGSQVGSLIILTVCAVYLTFCAYSIKSKTNK